MRERRIEVDVLHEKHVEYVDAVAEARTLLQFGSGLCVGSLMTGEPTHNGDVEGQNAA